jgi:hypothetical protein
MISSTVVIGEAITYGVEVSALSYVK